MCDRVLLVTPSALSLPACTCGITGCTGENMIWTRPPMRSVTACAVPLYGTCVMSTRATLLKSSPARCEPEPLPDETKLIAPGFDFASATRSRTDDACKPGYA